MPANRDRILGYHIDIKGGVPMRKPIVCPINSIDQYSTAIMIPKINPTVCPHFFAIRPSETAKKKKQKAPKGTENFL
jgi:hypothetical protein